MKQYKMVITLYDHNLGLKHGKNMEEVKEIFLYQLNEDNITQDCIEILSIEEEIALDEGD